MSFDWLQYLILAKELDGQATAPASPEARRRSAISRAYYAAFIGARNYLQKQEGHSIPKTSDAHKYVSEQFKRSSDPVRQDIGRKLERLRTTRNQADYNDTATGLFTNTKIAIKRAEQIISKLSSL